MVSSAEVLVPSLDLTADIALLEAHGFQLDVIFPADEPRVARMSGNGLKLRLDTASAQSSPTIMLRAVENEFVTSGGTRLVAAESPSEDSAFADELVITRGGQFGQGRAGMHYRDLIPNRHGGRVIASHIRIAEPGPVPDSVHHHDIRFQMIYCRRGRVEVVYEDQGESFWMEEGDCVLQPPHIRHRVLASADGLEVIEIASPAEHPTFIEHDIELPTQTVDPHRDFDGQRFSFDRAVDTPWAEHAPGWEQRTTGIAAATNGLAAVQVLRPTTSDAVLTETHDGDLHLLYVLSGVAVLDTDDADHDLSVDDSVAIPRNQPWTMRSPSSDFSFLTVNLAAQEDT